jgi:PIN domain nuclease of toxin-antitoxin system
MRLLLDTHVFLWWLAGDRRLSKRLRTLIADPSTVSLVSAASAWEIVAGDVAGAIASQGWDELPIRVLHAQRAGLLAGQHRDPFDRMLVAQSEIEGVPLASNDVALDALGAVRVW